MEDIVVRRFNLHVGNIEGYIWNHEQVFDFCLEHSIIGTGWGIECEYTVDNFRKEFPNNQGGIKAMNALEDMRENDLIWTRRKGIYYLCRVKNNMTYHISKDRQLFEKQKKEYAILNDISYEDLLNADIWNFVECDFCYIGSESNVFGSVVNSMAVGGVTQIVRKGEEALVEYSKRMFNKNSNSKYKYKLELIKDKWKYFWGRINSEELEEIIGLYLQIEKNYGVYTSTCKKSTIQAEFELFDRQTGEKAFLQVKEYTIDIKQYIDLAKEGKVYIFSNDDFEYEKVNNIIRITRTEVEKFIVKRLKMLPRKIKYIFEEEV